MQNEEINAILQFLETYVKAFNPKHIKRDILNVLIRKSTVLEIDGGSQAYSHLTDSLINNNIRGSITINNTNKHVQANNNEKIGGPRVADHNAIEFKLG